jgi:alpha-ribazole phosphatase/probable phosphoglycerate mutase
VISTRIDLLRHGLPVGGRRYRGRRDDPLSEAGWAQMRAAVNGHDAWEAIVTSPLQRCAAFAHELGARLAVAVHEDERLQEIGFGAWEGRTPEELEAADPGALERFRCDPVRHRPPGAESLESFGARVGAAWDELVARHRGRRVLVVAHAGVIRLVVSRVLDAPIERMFRLAVGHAALTRIRVHGEGERALPEILFHGGRP